MIITSHSYVSQEGQATPWQLGIYDDKFISELQEMVSVVHENGGKIAMQLAHAGQYAEKEITGWPALAVSENSDFPPEDIKAITSRDIQRFVSSYALAAKRVQKAGIREPDLINRWKNGDRRKSECKSDNLCFNPGFEGKGVYCVTQEREKT